MRKLGVVILLAVLCTVGCAGVSKVIKAAPSVETTYYVTLDLYVAALTEANVAYAAEPKPVPAEVTAKHDEILAYARQFQGLKKKAKAAIDAKNSPLAVEALAEMTKLVSKIRGGK